MDMIKQTLREQCMWDTMTIEQRPIWFNYMEFVIDECIDKNGTSQKMTPITEECQERVFERVSKQDPSININ